MWKGWLVCTTTSRQYVDLGSVRKLNDRLSIAFKSTGVANWDPQPAVAKFFTEKNTEIKTDIKNANLFEFF